eukprot:6199010-Amphidinium_carterae.1
MDVDAERLPQGHSSLAQVHRPVYIRQLRRSFNMARTCLQESTRDIPWSVAQQFNYREQILLKRLRKLHCSRKACSNMTCALHHSMAPRHVDFGCSMQIRSGILQGPPLLLTRTA